MRLSAGSRRYAGSEFHDAGPDEQNARGPRVTVRVRGKDKKSRSHGLYWFWKYITEHAEFRRVFDLDYAPFSGNLFPGFVGIVQVKRYAKFEVSGFRLYWFWRYA